MQSARYIHLNTQMVEQKPGFVSSVASAASSVLLDGSTVGVFRSCEVCYADSDPRLTPTCRYWNFPSLL